ncbi:uncharacterized protein LOC122016359 [Zingiber officinale]|uniref:uncharacterized protein LOC122016359 n=1 Tax=Zingiber officinale TaxID=94328 RepID=UPI001C4CDC43|nr:uncharacterized protein LOC122016359 [Zingiber officinale]
MARRDVWEKLPLSVLDPSPPRRRSSYLRLPEQIIRLSVLKLDGSSFNVEVARAATVVDLKMNIEHIFDKLAEEGGCIISWSHVWGHFCLCYHEYKLIDDGTRLLTLGIKDGDQLHFARHTSPNQNHLRKTDTALFFLRRSFTWQHIVKEVDNDARSCQEQEGCIASHKNSKLGHLFQGWNDGLGSSCKTKSRGVSTKMVRRRKRISWAICY